MNLSLTRRFAQQKGAALIFVLWILTLLSLIAGSFTLSTRRENEFLHHASEAAKSNALADAAIRYAVLMLLLPDRNHRWRADGTPYQWDTDEGHVTIRILDESGKININAVQEPTLRLVLSMALGNQEQVSELVDTIQDWRDADSNRRTYGAEFQDYTEPKSPKPQNRNFSSIEELSSVKGITPEVFHQIAPWFTVFTGQGGLNFGTASRKILMDLSGGDIALVENYIRERQLGGTPAFSSPRGINPQSDLDTIYTIIVTSHLDGSLASTTTSATVKVVPNGDPEPFLFLAYQSGSGHFAWRGANAAQ